MDIEALYERWRDSRSRVEPSGDFADRNMQSIHEEPPANNAVTSQLLPERSRAVQLARAGAVAAAVLAALFRVVELVSVFSATGIEN
jgi:hypothetical protein